MANRVDFLKQVRNTLAGVAASCFTASAVSAWAVGPGGLVGSSPAFQTIWLGIIAALTLVGTVVAGIIALGFHHDYLDASRSN